MFHVNLSTGMSRFIEVKGRVPTEQETCCYRKYCTNCDQIPVVPTLITVAGPFFSWLVQLVPIVFVLLIRCCCHDWSSKMSVFWLLKIRSIKCCSTLCTQFCLTILPQFHVHLSTIMSQFTKVKGWVPTERLVATGTIVPTVIRYQWFHSK